MFDFLSGGTYSESLKSGKSLQTAFRYVAYNLIIFAMMAAATAFFILNYVQYTAGLLRFEAVVVSVIMGVIGLSLYIAGRLKVSIDKLAVILNIVYVIFCSYMIFFFIEGSISAVWIFPLPMVCFSIITNKKAISFVTFAYAIAISTSIINSEIYYPPDSIRLYGISFFTALLTYFVFVHVNNTMELLRISQKALKNERNELATMKDNIDIGVFTLNEDFKIQPLYSNIITNLFEKENLDHADFVSLFKITLKENEIESLRKFLQMVLHSSHSQDILDDINPLKNLTCVFENGAKKVLDISLVPLDRGSHTIILGTVKDITSEVEMKNRLAKEEQLRQSDMATLYEVMHITPQILHDYIDDADYQFTKINKILKENKLTKLEALKQLYQSIHAVKSNAAIIGLSTTAEKLHEFESQIKAAIENPNAENESILSIVLELNTYLNLNAKIEDVLEKIENYTRSNTTPLSRKDILIQALKAVIEKDTSNMCKKAELKIEELEWDTLLPEHRQMIKEILLQLARNAMAHGIEECEYRVQNGKTESGLIKLRVQQDAKEVYISFCDDGRGIDFEKVRSIAIAKNLISDETSARDKEALLQAMLSHGFSTSEDISMHAGRGVGLSLVSERVNEYKGTLEIHSEVNSGTKFTITLPFEA